jgi:hypothetical protein
LAHEWKREDAVAKGNGKMMMRQNHFLKVLANNLLLVLVVLRKIRWLLACGSGVGVT